MASRTFEVSGLQEIETALGKIGNGDIGRKCLEVASPIVKSTYEGKLQRHYVTGAMSKSVRATKPKRNTWGWMTVVRPTGKDKNGTRNMAKACYLEYGVRKRNIPADPMRSRTVAETKEKVIKTMWETFENEVSKL